MTLDVPGPENVSQYVIHQLEADGDIDGAAHLLVKSKFYQVSRNYGLLARLSGDDGLAALRMALLQPSWQRRPMKEVVTLDGLPIQDEMLAGRHYLQHYAPPEDRVYVRQDTMDRYRELGGGPYQGIAGADSWGRTRRMPVLCIHCGRPASVMTGPQCELCYQVTTRLDVFMARPGGEDYVLKLIGKMGLHQVVTILMAREDNAISRSDDSDSEKDV